MPPPMPSHLFVACSTHVHTYILYKTGTCLACVLCTSGPHMPPPKSPARLDLHSCTIGVVHYSSLSVGPFSSWAKQIPTPTLLCLRPTTLASSCGGCKTNTVWPGISNPHETLCTRTCPHVTYNATIKSLIIIFKDKASSRPYVLDLYLQLHLLIPASRLHTCKASSTVTPSNARRIQLTKGLRHEIPQIFCAKSTSSDVRPIQLVLFLFLVKSKSAGSSSPTKRHLGFIPPSLDSSEPSLHLTTLSAFAAKEQLSSCANSSTITPSIISCSTAA
ncbi:hypothetical protein GGP41_004780 [Bipolaris sorokiniana]|uniref:Uncharacterized protein n=1 Tax=Cochliobolus sativus TaxID=45130 RepID=A0A8H5ZDK9_COCSA|nr:hypothetical protein GGP41_004780 [Bipolaris sorokiniana]